MDPDETSLREAVDLLSMERPDGRPSLLFLADLLDVQEEISRSLVAEIEGADELREAARRAIDEGRPVLEVTGLPEVPRDLILRATREVLGVVERHRDDLADQVAELRGAVEDGRLRPMALLSAVLRGDLDTIQRAAESVGVDSQLLHAVVLWVTQPALRAVASLVSGELNLERWYRGYCPVCGSRTRIGYMRGEGKKLFLRCDVCGTEWPFRRVTCPFCGNEDQERLGYIVVDGDRRFRLYHCDECGSYWKVVDEELVGRRVPRELYDFWTSHLDEVAAERGMR